MRIDSGTPQMELLRIELVTGSTPENSAMDREEFLHLYALLRRLPGADRVVRADVFSKLLARGFEHRYASSLVGLVTAGTQPLALLVRQACVRPELKFLAAA